MELAAKLGVWPAAISFIGLLFKVFTFLWLAVTLLRLGLQSIGLIELTGKVLRNKELSEELRAGISRLPKADRVGWAAHMLHC